MLALKDLQNRVYSGKTCIRFECAVPIDENHQVNATFRKMQNPREWEMQIIFDRTRDKDSEVYNFKYIMPKEVLPLNLIAATGLRYFQLHIKKEVQLKSNLDFELGKILVGM